MPAGSAHFAALLAKKSGRPVKIMTTGEEELTAAYPRQGTLIELKTGMTRDGTFLVEEDTSGGYYDKFRGRLIFPIREERGDYSLEFLGAMGPLEARDWLTQIGHDPDRASYPDLYRLLIPEHLWGDYDVPGWTANGIEPWGLQMELISYPKGMAYEKDAKSLLWMTTDPVK